MFEENFSERMVQLRMKKGVSARDMSLSIGQNAGYMHNIESGKAFPSMAAFFYICEYLDVTPGEFFDLDSPHPAKEKELLAAVRGLPDEQLDHLIALAKGLKK